MDDWINGHAIGSIGDVLMVAREELTNGVGGTPLRNKKFAFLRKFLQEDVISTYDCLGKILVK